MTFLAHAAFNLRMNALVSFVFSLGVVAGARPLPGPRDRNAMKDLVAQRRCFILIGGDRLKTSLTGDDFDEKPKAPGHFRVELALTRERRRLLVEVATPEHAHAAP